MTPDLRIKIDRASLPVEPGCLSLLIKIAEGRKVEAVGSVPAALKGAKWADTYSWTVFFWYGGRIWVSRTPLKTESPAPWCFNNLRMHFCQHNNMWEELT